MRGWFDGPKYQKTTAKAYIGDQDNRTAAGSAPGYGRYWHLHCNETNGTALTDLKVQVEIIYMPIGLNQKIILVARDQLLPAGLLMSPPKTHYLGYSRS